MSAPVRERPIVFSGPDVRAILDGRKVQTRRTRGLPSANRNWREVRPSDGDPRVWLFRWECATYHIRCPYGAPGDRLWVRETFIHEASTLYRADCDYDETRCAGWSPAIVMPRHLSRITLEITDIRVQRLQDISEEDALAEGVTTRTEENVRKWGYDQSPRMAFADLWESINGPGSWDANPLVWAISFVRVTP